jgi:valine--pyruvate aminotransferase
MARSLIGDKMASMSGLRSIMEDIATSTSGSDAGEWLNLSIGNPAPIPQVMHAWQELAEEALEKNFAEASCNYGPSRGTASLVLAITDYFNERYNWGIQAENVIVGPGSQMLCFIAAALYAGPGRTGQTRVVMPMMPDYTGYQGLCMSADGIAGVGSGVEISDDGRRFRYTFDFAALEKRADIGMLLLSSPSNPAGRCVERDELRELIRIAEERDVPLLLDHAYGEPFPQICRTAVPPPWHSNVINCFTLSKAGLPGERIGFAIGPERYITEMVSFLSNSSLHASRLAQVAVANGLRSGSLDRLVSTVITPFYANRRAMAEQLLADNMPSDIRWRLHSGDGGLFCWVWIDEDWFDDIELYQLLKQKHVFVTPGRNFFVISPDGPSADAHQTRCLRISLSPSEEVLTEGIKRIADALVQLRECSRQPTPQP